MIRSVQSMIEMEAKLEVERVKREFEVEQRKQAEERAREWRYEQKQAEDSSMIIFYNRTHSSV